MIPYGLALSSEEHGSADLEDIARQAEAGLPVTSEQIADEVQCGPDLDPLVESVNDAVDAGVDHVSFHQVGDPRDGFVDAFVNQLRPRLP